MSAARRRRDRSTSPAVEGCVLVTGGSRGLGRAIVEGLLARPVAGLARVAFTYRSGEEEAREIEEQSERRAVGFQLDLADRARPKALVGEVEERVGAVLGLVCNAGIQRSQLLAMTSDRLWDEVMEVNLGGVFRCCRAVVPGMVRARKGSIVNLSSLGAVRGVAGQAAYAASKAGVLALTRSLAREVGGRGVRVNAVVPGYVATDMTSDLPDAAVDALRSSEALPEGVGPASVASAVRWLLSEESSSVTGQSVHVDAGASI